MSVSVFRFKCYPLLCAGVLSVAVAAGQEGSALPASPFPELSVPTTTPSTFPVPTSPTSDLSTASVPDSSVLVTPVPATPAPKPSTFPDPTSPTSDLSTASVPDSSVLVSFVPERRPLDCREHQGYTSWKRLLPTHVKAQYAGGMGFLSVGYGWDYGRKCRWETDLLFGVLPKAYSDKTHITFTLKQNYIPWSIRCWDWLSIEPFSCGAYLNLISGEDFWIREPDRYPGDKYYNFTSRIRLHLYAGQRFTFQVRRESLLRHITLYYEFSANDLDIVAKFGNRTLDFTDIIYFSVGIKFQLFGSSL